MQHAAIGVQCEYDLMRGEVGAYLFDGNPDFSVADCLNPTPSIGGFDLGSHHLSGWGDGGSGDGGGSDAGGGGDGGDD